MNQDERQNFLSHVYDELLQFEKSPKRRNTTGNTKSAASGRSTSAGTSCLIQRWEKKADVPEIYMKKKADVPEMYMYKKADVPEMYIIS